MRSKFSICLRVYLMAFILMMTSLSMHSQAKSKRNTPPEKITIEKTEFNRILDLSKGSTLISANKYLHKAKVITHTKNGDMQFLRLKLAAFPKAYMSIQVNGEYSTQVFVLSDNHKLSYKGEVSDREVILIKCREDEIVAE